MSYCVNCGVKLAESEKKCPLCHCPVVNPMEPQKADDAAQQTERPYPKRRDSIKNIVDRSFIISVVSILYVLPLAICLLIDWMLDRALSWSVISSVAIILSWALFFQPALFHKKYFACYTAVDFCLLAALFYTIGWYTGDYGWIGTLGIPIALAVYLLANLLAYLILSGVLRRKLYIGAAVLLSAGVFSVLVGVLVWRYEVSVLHLEKPFEFWSLITLFSCAAVAGVLCYIEKKKRLKKSLEKKLHI